MTPNGNQPPSEAAYLHEVARNYKEQGYNVIIEPPANSIPFDLGGYRPDLLVEKADEHLLIEVRNPRIPLNIDRFQEVILTVRQHAGWRFLLVNTEVRDTDLAQLLSWQDVQLRASSAMALIENGAAEAAFLMLWAALEALLRRHAEQVGLSLERQSSQSLIKQLYSQGEISIPQYELAMDVLKLRNQLAHGYLVASIEPAARQLHGLLTELLTEWSAEAHQAV